MSATNERNEQVREILDYLYNKAVDDSVKIDESAYKGSLEKLFSTTAWGFREILLVVIIGMRLDHNFKASTGLYDCNPRAIYEGPIKEFLIEKACFSKSQLEILIKQYNLDYSNESKASLMSTEKFPPIFTLLITPFTICVTTFLAQQKDYVVYAFLFGGIYYAVLCIIFMIFQCIDPFINKENYLAKDLVLLLLDFELELPTSNKEPEDNIQQIKHERIEQGENQ